MPKTLRGQYFLRMTERTRRPLRESANKLSFMFYGFLMT